MPKRKTLEQCKRLTSEPSSSHGWVWMATHGPDGVLIQVCYLLHIRSPPQGTLDWRVLDAVWLYGAGPGHGVFCTHSSSVSESSICWFSVLNTDHLFRAFQLDSSRTFCLCRSRTRSKHSSRSFQLASWYQSQLCGRSVFVHAYSEHQVVDQDQSHQVSEILWVKPELLMFHWQSWGTAEFSLLVCAGLWISACEPTDNNLL